MLCSAWQGANDGRVRSVSVFVLLGGVLLASPSSPGVLAVAQSRGSGRVSVGLVQGI